MDFSRVEREDRAEKRRASRWQQANRSFTRVSRGLSPGFEGFPAVFAIVAAIMTGRPLRHLDRHLEEAVKRIRRILPLAAAFQRLLAVNLVGANYTACIKIGLP